jgi:chemotaxis regulatin CheY-phosphate phosphatase CheZ
MYSYFISESLNYMIIYTLIGLGILSFLVLSYYVYVKVKNLEKSNKSLINIILKLEHVIHLTNQQIQESVDKIGKGTNGAIDQFSQVIQISDSINKDLEKIKEASELNKDTNQLELLNSIRKNSNKQNEKLFQVISELQFEDITRQINTHISNLLNLVTVELKNQKKIYIDSELEDEIKKKIVENYMQFSTMKSERDIAVSYVQKEVEPKKNEDSDITFF